MSHIKCKHCEYAYATSSDLLCDDCFEKQESRRDWFWIVPTVLTVIIMIVVFTTKEGSENAPRECPTCSDQR